MMLVLILGSPKLQLAPLQLTGVQVMQTGMI
jgi:hypothetical protein